MKSSFVSNPCPIKSPVKAPSRVLETQACNATASCVFMALVKTFACFPLQLQSSIQFFCCLFLKPPCSMYSGMLCEKCSSPAVSDRSAQTLSQNFGPLECSVGFHPITPTMFCLHWRVIKMVPRNKKITLHNIVDTDNVTDLLLEVVNLTINLVQCSGVWNTV